VCRQEEEAAAAAQEGKQGDKEEGKKTAVAV
jgi:hypothetical protein